MKRTYELAEMEVVHFEVEDIITTSGAGLTNGGTGSGNVVNFGDLFPDLVDQH